jgi:hypothetical protein
MRRYRALGVILGVTLALGTSCGMMRQRKQIREGFITRGLIGKAFVKEWGLPARTRVVGCGEGTEASWGGGNGGFGGSFYQGKMACEVWEYPDHGISLMFKGAHLVDWKTDRSVAELRKQ